jgi:hypothetical protein
LKEGVPAVACAQKAIPILKDVRFYLNGGAFIASHRQGY